MKKVLYFYWYVSKKGWHQIYDLHLENLNRYKDIFDSVNFVISTDEDTDEESINKTIDKLKGVRNDANFIRFRNDKQSRESKFFYDELICNLPSFPENVAIFFAHNKGVDSRYVSSKELKNWINVMYFANLSNKEKISELLVDNNTYTIGTNTIVNYNSSNLKFAKYKWHYSGTFFWLVPKRIYLHIIENGIEVLDNTGRYYAEGFWGTIFPADSEHCVKLFGTKKNTDTFKSYVERFDEVNKKKYKEIYGEE